MSQQNKHIYVFGAFRFDPRESLLLRDNRPVALTPKVADTLHVLLQNAGNLVDKDELMRRVWPDAIVEEGNLNKNVFVLRKTLGKFDGGREYIETVPKRGYRFVAPVDGEMPESVQVSPKRESPPRSGLRQFYVLGAVCAFLALASWAVYREWFGGRQPTQRTLTRVTFDDGLQIGATWSPDGRYLAYSSDRGGKFDIWIQQLSGGDPVQVTKGAGHHWQPDWSPDGKYIAYRSEGDSSGIYVIPALGGVGLERKISTFGYYPRWSPDGTRVLIQPTSFPSFKSLYVADIGENSPHEVLTDFFAKHTNLLGRAAAWHPDGKRISICAQEPESPSAIWTLQVSGGPSAMSLINAALFHEKEEPGFGVQSAADFKFSWAPSGDSIYIERTFAGADNLWKLSIEPSLLQVTAATRLTTSVGTDTLSALSPDGRKLAFTAESRRIRVWTAPFDSSLGKLKGAGESVTSSSIEPWAFDLSHDGSKLVYSGRRANQWGTWEKSLADGREVPIEGNDSYRRSDPLWSPDGSHVVYKRWSRTQSNGDIVLWNTVDHKEQVLATEDMDVDGWSPDGILLLVSRWNRTTGHAEIWSWPLASSTDKPTTRRKLVADPEYYLFQAQLAPNGRWITFEAVRDRPNGRESTIYVVPSTGGPWIRLTDGEQWDDKPRWSPDGKTIYFVSSRGGFANVWGRRFEALRGDVVGEPFQVTNFANPALMPPILIPAVGLSVANGRLAVTVSETSGGIWVLDNVDH